jgi:hypothetical protein
MRKKTAILVIALVVLAGIATSALYAQDNRNDGMMGQNGMMGMMGMMRQMSQMMDHCNQMMSGNPRDGGRPNDQWRKETPAPPGRNG